MKNKWKYYNITVLILDFISIFLWMYLFFISIGNQSNWWTITFWIIMEIVSIINLYRDIRLFQSNKQ